MYEKRWIYLDKQIDEEIIEKISNEFKVEEIIAKAIINRGIEKTDDVRKYLSKSIANIHHPYKLKDMEQAVERVTMSINNCEKITVYGDYDVDGITSTSLLVMFLRLLNANVDYYIPDRADEGYGINSSALERLANMGTKLVITVDCGITAVDEVKVAKKLGLDVIITDHHNCKDYLPKAIAVINPKQVDCKYPFKDLAGVGVTFKLVLALAIRFGISTRECFDRYIDIVAVGTIADVVPLVDENRIIVNSGLRALSKTNNYGLEALIKTTGLANKKIDSSAVGFVIAPRINAAGRVSNASIAVELLISKDRDFAYSAALQLNEENRMRQMKEQEIFKEAIEVINNDEEIKDKSVMVLCGDGWHHGVIGIVASRIADKFYKPCILLSVENGVAKGSGRSIKGLNLFDTLSYVSELLLKFGGHEMAAGLSIKYENIEEFVNKINTYVSNNLDEDDIVPTVYLDSCLNSADINLETAKRLSVLEPFGTGNSRPIFSIDNAMIANIHTMGIDGKHLRLKIEKDGTYFDAVGFNMGTIADEFPIKTMADFAFWFDINTYYGEQQLQLVIKDIKSAN